MDALKTSNQKPILVKIADQLLKDQEELDTLAVQISLGKSEVKDKFEEAKGQMKKSIREFKVILSSEYDQNREWAGSFRNKLNELNDILNEGKAETKLMFVEQKKNILKGMEVVKNEMKNNPEVVRLAGLFSAASEKIKLQLSLFEKKLSAEKMELTNDFKLEMNDAREKINAVIAKAKIKKDDIDFKVEKFNDEIQAAYYHLKKAIQVL